MIFFRDISLWKKQIYHFSEEKNPQIVFVFKKVRIFATAKPKGAHTLGYGVMVTLQILVLSFLVRIQVAQQ